MRHPQNESFGDSKVASCMVELRFSLSRSCSSEARAAVLRCCGALGLEDVHGPHDVLPADRALAHPLAALGAGDHVAALQENTVDRMRPCRSCRGCRPGPSVDPSSRLQGTESGDSKCWETALLHCEEQPGHFMHCGGARSSGLTNPLLLSRVPYLGQVTLTISWKMATSAVVGYVSRCFYDNHTAFIAGDVLVREWRYTANILQLSV